MAMIEMVSSAFYDTLGSLWVELAVVFFFALGFALLRADIFVRTPSPSKHKKVDELKAAPFDAKLKKQIEAEAAADNLGAVLEAWREGKMHAPTPHGVLKFVVYALANVEPQSLVEELVEHMHKFPITLCNARSAIVMLDAIARTGHTDVMDDLWHAFVKRLHIAPTLQAYEVLLSGFAFVGNEKRVRDLFAEIRAKRFKLTARSHSLIIKGFLKNSMLDAVLQQIKYMRQQSFFVPSFAITQFFRVACDAGRASEMFDQLTADVALPAEAISLLFEHCCRRSEVQFAHRVESHAREAKIPFLGSAYDALLKVYTSAADLHVIDLFEEIQASGTRISEGLCVGLLTRCADTKFLRFAEEIVCYTRSRKSTTIAVYSALMKVYAYCGMYDKACGLYDRIREDGLEPDVMMYGCLMKFAVECGRTDLSRELSEKAPSLDIQNYMSLIRAAGRDKDVDRAFAVLQKLKDSAVTLDIAAYNCVLDVCVSMGDMARACSLVEEIKSISMLDIITYNTLLKGYCTIGDLAGAKQLLVKMESAGFMPNDVSYNCLINAAVSRGNFREAWGTIEEMERRGVPADQYTISIMMKAMRKAKNPQDIGRALTLLDHTGFSVCSDEVLLNTVLETCIRFRECQRLESMLTEISNSNFRPSVHTYGALIKAASTLKRTDKCWEFWKEMTVHRAMLPSDIVLGCMLDALVCNRQIDDAVVLFETWRGQVPPNSVMYSTLFKGFAICHQPGRAMTMWRSMRQQGVMMNTVLYNTVIDAQARVGAMTEVCELLDAMDPDGCTPDVITYSTIVKGYCVKGDLTNAFKVFHNMQKCNMAGDCVIYNTILDGCVRNNRMDLADVLLEDMTKFKITPSGFTVGILVKMYGRRRQLDKAFNVVEEVSRNHGFVPNLEVKLCLICACIANQALDRAFEVFNDVKSSGQNANPKTYGVMISACVRQGELQKAVFLVEEAYGFAQDGRARLDSSPGAQGLEPECLERLLRALQQHKLMDEVGMPLLQKLRSAKAPATMRLFSSIMNFSGPNMKDLSSTGKEWPESESAPPPGPCKAEGKVVRRGARYKTTT